MAGTFGEQIVQFARALDSIDVRNFKRIRELIEKYTKRTLEITSTQLLVAAEVNHGDTGTVGLTPYRLAQEGDIRVTPLRDRAGRYTGQASLAFETGKSLWIVSGTPKEERLDEARAYRDLWSSSSRLPRYRAIGQAPIRTSILIPLRYANGRVFGVAGFETVERLDITAGARRELEHLAFAFSICYRLFRDSESRATRTREGLMALNELLNEPLVKLTKPSIFLASSTRAKGDVVAAMRAVISEREFRDVFRETYWKDMNRPGSITQQLLGQLGRCRFGVCYMSEATDEGETPFRDNINVVFEAGMLHGRSDIGSPVPASWIPVREAASPPTPFDFATQRMIVVPRGRDSRLDAKRFKDLFRSGLRGLLADDPSR